MKATPDILFSRRFQQIHHCLGVFAYTYILEGEKGIERRLFTSGAGISEDALSFLTASGIVSDSDGMLHLDCRLFFRLTLWDLLVMCEPWLAKLQDEPACPPGMQDYAAIKELACSGKLSSTYTDIYP